jgi:kynureninase
MNFENTKQFALDLDSKDNLASYRDKFFIPKKNGKEVIYFAGNSLGLQPKSVRQYIEQELKDWESLGVEAHFKAKNPWLPYHEFLTKQTAEIVGAKPEEVVNMNALTVNLHLMFVSFYRPTSSRNKIVIESNAFPSDNYAVKSQIKFHGFDPADSLIVLKPRENESYIRTEDIEKKISNEGDSIALIWLPGVNYYSGQSFDIERITKAAHSKGCYAGFDLAHAAGNIILNLHDWNVDFAVWCTYKYLNGGSGAVGGCFVHEKHLKDKQLPKFAGWWGHNKETRFLMPPEFEPIPTVESWQVSNPPILQMAALKASLDIFSEVGMTALRKKGEVLTGYLEYLINQKRNDNIEIITPAERGCQLSMRVKSNGKELHKKLIDGGVMCDWREPDVIRVAPVPLYNTFAEVYDFVEILDKSLGFKK